MNTGRNGACASPITSEPGYDADDVEFMKAVHEYKKKHRRPFPTFCEILAIAKSLGYRKVAPEGPLPQRKEED